MKSNPPPIYRQIASLWSLTEYPNTKKPWSLEQQLEDIQAAGFDGFTSQLSPEHGRLAAKLGLIPVGYFASAKASEFDACFKRETDAGAKHINVQLADHDTLTPEATRLTLRIMELAEKYGVSAYIEVHRDTCTETPEKTYALASAYRKATGKLLPMTWDFSHISAVKHLAPPYWERLLVAPKLVQCSQLFHLRPFNGHHAQVPVTDGKGGISHELNQWLPFVGKTFEMWLQGSQSGREIFVVPEMGPVPGGYNFAQLPNSWEDAKVLRPILEKIWKKTLSAHNAK